MAKQGADQTTFEALRRQNLRALPSVDVLLRTETANALRTQLGASRVANLARVVAAELRVEVQTNTSNEGKAGKDYSREALLKEAEHRLEEAAKRESSNALRRVINASGVILHTNLGRAPLSHAAREAIIKEASGYCTLEYDLQTGARGLRGARVEELLIELTGAEAALVVNNCAAAALLVLTALAANGETVISRGELVEIGGDFRVPDVMQQSRTRMIEVGTTNRTRLSDYERAINEHTKLLLRVHPSNYRIVGFTSTPTLNELAELAHDKDLLIYEDAGSGAIFDLSAYGLNDEPVMRESINAGVDLVSFSGDKLLGATQAGLIVGRRAAVETLRKHPLYRALRVDKLTLAALAATLDAHLREASFAEVPVLHMLALSYEELDQRARQFLLRMAERSNATLQGEIIEGNSAIGGGAAPTTRLRTPLIALSHETLSAENIERALRYSDTPVVARINENRVLLDLRTVAIDEEPELLDALARL